MRQKGKGNTPMQLVIVDISMSLDGFIAGANVSRENPLGDGGEQLHEWFFGKMTPVDEAIMDDHKASTGAVIVGGRTYKDAIDDGWNGENPFHVPPFVVLHALPARMVEGFTFVTDGIESALVQAKVVADTKNVWIMGGANLIQQYLASGLIDEIHLHIAPILLGRGIRLFDHPNQHQATLEKMRVVETPAATHLFFRMGRR
jgi:dihydrofolate reductase